MRPTRAGLLLTTLLLAACATDPATERARNPGDGTHPECHPTTGPTPIIICHTSAEDAAACPF